MISPYFIGVLTGWVSLGGGYALLRLAWHYEAQPRIPKTAPVPRCLAVAGGFRCERPLGHEPTPHCTSNGGLYSRSPIWWDTEEAPPPAPRNTLRIVTKS